jgi:hypothetical protein
MPDDGPVGPKWGGLLLHKYIDMFDGMLVIN